MAELVKLTDIPASLSENGLSVLRKRYLIKDAEGNPTEAPEDMFLRVAQTIADVERKYGGTDADVNDWTSRYYWLMTQRYFEPNSPTLMNAGRPLGQLSACFVLPVEDALTNGKDGIYDTLRHMAQIHQSGGGTGFSFSRLRAEGAMVRSSTGVASGPISFMSLYDYSTNIVKQGGTRRGANMGILRVDHPDVLKFIGCKRDTSQITNFNISVALTDEFMDAVENDLPFALRDPATGSTVGEDVSAREVFDLMVENAWLTGEPGVFFIDEANRHNPVPHLGDYEATNPCGEQPLLPYDVCNLGSVNVGMFVTVGPDGKPTFDWDHLGEVVAYATRFLDGVIDANHYPLPEVRDLADRIRRIGLGIMGFADALIGLGIPYGSEESFRFAEELMAFVNVKAREESIMLSGERGVFPEWEKSVWGPEGKNLPLRNCNITTIAPTGTISMIADCSGGIEPLFAVAFFRNQAGLEMVEVNKQFVSVAKREGWYSEELMERIAREGHIHQPEVPEHVQKVFVTAHDVTPEQHVRMQAAFQMHVDSAISKTCNFPAEATQDDVREVYLMAHRLGLKGVTVYRDGSRGNAPLTTGATDGKEPTPLTAQEIVPAVENACPECGMEMVEIEGCHSCFSCGISACSI